MGGLKYALIILSVLLGFAVAVSVYYLVDKFSTSGSDSTGSGSGSASAATVTYATTTTPTALLQGSATTAAMTPNAPTLTLSGTTGYWPVANLSTLPLTSAASIASGSIPGLELGTGAPGELMVYTAGSSGSFKYSVSCGLAIEPGDSATTDLTTDASVFLSLRVYLVSAITATSFTVKELSEHHQTVSVTTGTLWTGTLSSSGVVAMTANQRLMVAIVGASESLTGTNLAAYYATNGNPAVTFELQGLTSTVSN